MKSERHSKIVHLIKEFEIETQEELAKYLVDAGFNVTQATISRDIKELKLTKVIRNDGRSIYTILQEPNKSLSEKYTRVLRDAYISMDVAGHLLVMKTVPGMAMAVGAALDGLEWSEILGCIAGDDTVMCAVRTEDNGTQVMEKIRRIINAKE